MVVEVFNKYPQDVPKTHWMVHMHATQKDFMLYAISMFNRGGAYFIWGLLDCRVSDSWTKMFVVPEIPKGIRRNLGPLGIPKPASITEKKKKLKGVVEQQLDKKSPPIEKKKKLKGLVGEHSPEKKGKPLEQEKKLKTAVTEQPSEKKEGLRSDVQLACRFWDDERVKKALAFIQRGKSGWTFKLRERKDVESGFSTVEYEWTAKMFELPNQDDTQRQEVKELQEDEYWTTKAASRTIEFISVFFVCLRLIS
ncbi:hypothetical protein LINPERHAP1_LOCUS37573 [Linum perenne]